jgi:hypothetical protein
MPRRTLIERLEAAYVTGPAGHLVCGVLDFGELLGRYWWSKVRGR